MKTKKSISDDIRAAIALRAYYIWERTGRPDGCQQEHWAMAEAEILSEQPTPKAAAPKKPAKKGAAVKPAAKAARPEKPAEKPPEMPIAKPAAALNAKAKTSAKAATVDAKAKQPAKPKAGKSLPRQR